MVTLRQIRDEQCIKKMSRNSSIAAHLFYKNILYSETLAAATAPAGIGVIEIKTLSIQAI